MKNKKIIAIMLSVSVMLTGCVQSYEVEEVEEVEQYRTDLEIVIDGFQPLFDMINADSLDYLYTFENSDETRLDPYNEPIPFFMPEDEYRMPDGDEGVFRVYSTNNSSEILESQISLRRYEYYNRNNGVLSGTFFSEDMITGTEYAPKISEQDGEIIIHNGQTYEGYYYERLKDIPEEILEKYESYVPLYDIITIDKEYLSSMTPDEYHLSPGFSVEYTLSENDKNVQAILDAYPEIDMSRVRLIKLELIGTGAAAGTVNELEFKISFYHGDGLLIMRTGIGFCTEEQVEKYFNGIE